MTSPTAIKTNSEFRRFLDEFGPFAVAVWDFDGVIGDTEPTQAATYRRILADLGIVTPDDFFDDLAGRSEPEIWTSLQRRYGFGGDITALREKRVALVTPLLAAQIAPNWFVRCGLRCLSRAGTSSVIISSGNQEVVDHYLSVWRLAALFDDVSATSGKRRDPPKRERLRSAIEGVRALVIEDSAEYLRFVAGLGAATIGVGHTLDEMPGSTDAFLKTGAEPWV